MLEKNAETWIAPTINIITATCVTTLLYLAPGMRVGEYLEAWRLSEDAEAEQMYLECYADGEGESYYTEWY